MSGAVVDRYLNPYGWLDDPDCDDDDTEFSVMDLMRAGGMSLETAYSALYEEDLGTFCAKLDERASYVMKGMASTDGIRSAGEIGPSLVEPSVVHVVPHGAECVPVGSFNTRDVDLVDMDETMEVEALDEFHATVDTQCVRTGEHVLVATACDDGTLRVGTDGTLVEKCSSVDTAIVSVRGRWDERHCGVLTYLGGIARGVTLKVVAICPSLDEHEGHVPGEIGFHGCCQDWARLFGRLGHARIVPCDNGGGIVCMFFGEGIPPDLRKLEPHARRLRRGALYPMGGANGEGLSEVADPESFIYGANCMVQNGGPCVLQFSEPVTVDDVALFVQDHDNVMGYVLMRRYMTESLGNGKTGVTRERGEWRWYNWTNRSVPPGVYVVSLTLITDDPDVYVDPLMPSSWYDGEPCGFTVEMTFLDCLSSDVTPLCFRQAEMHVKGLHVGWAGIDGNYFLSDVFPGAGSRRKSPTIEPLITMSGELVMRTRREGLALSQLPFGRIARSSPGWSGKFCILLAKQWALIRRLWASRVRLPDKLLGTEAIRAIAKKDMYRWGMVDYTVRGKVSRGLFAEWIVGEQVHGKLEWVPPPAVAVLDPCGADSAYWDGHSLISTGYAGDYPFACEKFLNRVGPAGGVLMPDEWKPKYSALLKYANPETVGLMIKVWGRVPDVFSAPVGQEDIPGLTVIRHDRHCMTNDGGWPSYDEEYVCSVKDEYPDVPFHPKFICELDDNLYDGSSYHHRVSAKLGFSPDGITRCTSHCCRGLG